jgi:hypothetical protein
MRVIAYYDINRSTISLIERVKELQGLVHNVSQPIICLFYSINFDGCCMFSKSLMKQFKGFVADFLSLMQNLTDTLLDFAIQHSQNETQS